LGNNEDAGVGEGEVHVLGGCLVFRIALEVTDLCCLRHNF
jgi:hypothetical protein